MTTSFWGHCTWLPCKMTHGQKPSSSGTFMLTSHSSTLWLNATYCALKYHMFDNLMTVLQKTLETSSSSMSCRHIFQIEDPLLTSMLADRNGITQVSIRIELSALTHVKNVPGRLTPKCSFMQNHAQ
jgi:hypothetical protein